MPSIHVLPEIIQNKIAAGEVVERPASVVKELAENSLDAGATRIAVDMEEGGHRLIRVSDNGCGMSEQDLILSVQRHATSKIADVEDIFRVSTMGFRGEALPSIASVSRLTITTGCSQQEEGRQLVIEGGSSVRLSPAPPRRGTTVEARDLFFNTPARRKFLKQQAAETSRVAEVLTRLALARPDVDFRFQSGDRLALAAHAKQNPRERIAELFGDTLAERLAPVARESAEGIAVRGFAARPPEQRPNSTSIYIFLNRRWIKHPGIARVVCDAYGGLLPPRVYPFAVLFLEIDPERVDVNVHPAKEEVRFENERLVVASVRRAVEEALKPQDSTAQTFFSPPPTGKFISREAAPAPTRETPSAQPAKKSGKTTYFDPASFPPNPIRTTREQQPATLPATEPPSQENRPQPSTSPELPPPADDAEPATLPGSQPFRHRVFGQIGGKYLLVESETGLLLVDPHALHERWQYDRLLKKAGDIVSRRLLIPLRTELSPSESAQIDEALPILREIGFVLERNNGTGVDISATPEGVPPDKAASLLRQVLDDLDNAETVASSFRDRLLISMACHSAVLLGTTLPEMEVTALLDRLAQEKTLPTCPHGRPAVVTITWSELANRFGR